MTSANAEAQLGCAKVKAERGEMVVVMCSSRTYLGFDGHQLSISHKTLWEIHTLRETVHVKIWRETEYKLKALWKRMHVGTDTRTKQEGW